MTGLETLRSAKLREALVGYAFVALPMLVFFALFIYPIGYAVYISFFDWGIFGAQESVGLANYEELWHDEIFWRAVRNTVYYTLGVVPAQMALGLFVALVVNAAIRGRTFFRAAFYFPSLTSSAAITAIAVYILSADGLLNAIVGGASDDSFVGYAIADLVVRVLIAPLSAIAATVMFVELRRQKGDPLPEETAPEITPPSPPPVV